MKKVIIGCKSVFTYMKYKILYGSRIQMAKINSLKGRIEIKSKVLVQMQNAGLVIF